MVNILLLQKKLPDSMNLLPPGHHLFLLFICERMMIYASVQKLLVVDEAIAVRPNFYEKLRTNLSEDTCHLTRYVPCSD